LAININALENLKNDKSQMPATRCEANGVLQQLLSLETASMYEAICLNVLIYVAKDYNLSIWIWLKLLKYINY